MALDDVIENLILRITTEFDSNQITQAMKLIKELDKLEESGSAKFNSSQLAKVQALRQVNAELQKKVELSKQIDQALVTGDDSALNEMIAGTREYEQMVKRLNVALSVNTEELKKRDAWARKGLTPPGRESEVSLGKPGDWSKRPFDPPIAFAQDKPYTKVSRSIDRYAPPPYIDKTKVTKWFAEQVAIDQQGTSLNELALPSPTQFAPGVIKAASKQEIESNDAAATKSIRNIISDGYEQYARETDFENDENKRQEILERLLTKTNKDEILSELKKHNIQLVGEEEKLLGVSNDLFERPKATGVKPRNLSKLTKLPKGKVDNDITVADDKIQQYFFSRDEDDKLPLEKKLKKYAKEVSQTMDGMSIYRPGMLEKYEELANEAHKNYGYGKTIGNDQLVKKSSYENILYSNRVKLEKARKQAFEQLSEADQKDALENGGVFRVPEGYVQGIEKALKAYMKQKGNYTGFVEGQSEITKHISDGTIVKWMNFGEQRGHTLSPELKKIFQDRYETMDAQVIDGYVKHYTELFKEADAGRLMDPREVRAANFVNPFKQIFQDYVYDEDTIGNIKKNYQRNSNTIPELKEALGDTRRVDIGRDPDELRTALKRKSTDRLIKQLELAKSNPRTDELIREILYDRADKAARRKDTKPTKMDPKLAQWIAESVEYEKSLTPEDIVKNFNLEGLDQDKLDTLDNAAEEILRVTKDAQPAEWAEQIKLNPGDLSVQISNAADAIATSLINAIVESTNGKIKESISKMDIIGKPAEALKREYNQKKPDDGEPAEPGTLEPKKYNELSEAILNRIDFMRTKRDAYVKATQTSGVDNRLDIQNLNDQIRRLSGLVKLSESNIPIDFAGQKYVTSEGAGGSNKFDADEAYKIFGQIDSRREAARKRRSLGHIKDQELDSAMQFVEPQGLVKLAESYVGRGSRALKAALKGKIPGYRLEDILEKELDNEDAKKPGGQINPLQMFIDKYTGRRNKLTVSADFFDIADMDKFIDKARTFGDVVKVVRSDTHKASMSGFDETLTSRLNHVTITFSKTGKQLNQQQGAIERFVQSTRDMGLGLTSSVKLVDQFGDASDKSSNQVNKLTKMGHQVRGLAWTFTQLAMGALGTYFSMMSITRMIQTGVTSVLSPLTSLDGVMQSYAGMVIGGNETGLNPNSWMESADVDMGDIVTGWKTMQGIAGSIQFGLALIGAKMLTSTLDDGVTLAEKMGEVINGAFETLTTPENLTNIVKAVESIVSALPTIIENIPGLVGLLTDVLTFEMPDWMAEMPLIGGFFKDMVGKPLIAELGLSAIIAAFAMPILSILSALVTITGAVISIFGWLCGTTIWNNLKSVLLGTSVGVAAGGGALAAGSGAAAGGAAIGGIGTTITAVLLGAIATAIGHEVARSGKDTFENNLQSVGVPDAISTWLATTTYGGMLPGGGMLSLTMYDYMRDKIDEVNEAASKPVTLDTTNATTNVNTLVDACNGVGIAALQSDPKTNQMFKNIAENATGTKDKVDDVNTSLDNVGKSLSMNGWVGALSNGSAQFTQQNDVNITVNGDMTQKVADNMIAQLIGILGGGTWT